MGQAVSLSTPHWKDSDLNAIAVYLKSVPGRQDAAKPLPADDPVMTAGAAIYRDACSACHMLDGRGTSELFPSLAASSNVRSDDPATLIRVVLRGARSVATAAEPTSPGMPSYAWQLHDAKVAARVHFIPQAEG